MFTLVVLLTLVALACAYWFNKWKSLPPGPFPFPLIGNMPQFGTLVAKHGGIAEAMRELRRQYGPVFTLWLGPIPSVHICSIELAQETMHKRGSEFVDRWVPYLWSIVNDNKGIFNASGEHWQEQRRFMLHTFRNFGLGRGIMEERIMMELELRVKDLEALMTNDTVTFDPTEFFELLVGSIINRILSGERFDKDNEKQFFHLKHRMDEFTADFSLVDFFSDYKILWKVPYFRNRWNKMIEVMKDLEAFLLVQIRERVRDVNSGDRVIGENPEDYMDAFIQKIVEERGVPETGYTEESLAYNLMDLWSAGQETTTITLRSGFLQLIEQPEVLAKAREELKSVTENSRSLSLQDRKSTPYFNAVLTEMQRIANLLQINVFRQARGDTPVGGYTVPDGTPLAAEISVLMIDDEYFDHPDQFDPSRFIKNPDLEKHVLPFGIGKRACPGESLARAELYLLAGNLILRYNFQKKKGATKVDSVNCEGFFKTPPRYEMTVTKL